MKPNLSKSCAAIALVCLTIIVVIWAVTYERITFERADDIDQAVRQNANLALAFEEHTVRTLKVVDQALLVLKMKYETEGEHMPATLLREIAQLDPGTYAFFGIVNRRGNLVMSTSRSRPINVADREYFIQHRDDASLGLLVGRPVIGRMSGRMDIQVSRRMNNPDGSFAGVVVAGIAPEYFASFYHNIDLGPDGLVQLVGLDGILRARRTGARSSSGDDMRQSTLLTHAARSDSGSFVSVGRLDGVVRHQSFRVRRDLGLVVAVGTSEKQILAESRQRMLMYLVGSSAATIFVLFFGSSLIRAMRRQKRATDAALAGEALYRVTFEEAAVGITHATLDGRFLKANARYCEMTGYSEEELKSKRFQDLLCPEDASSEREITQLQETGRFESEKRHMRKDGSMVWMSVAVALVHGENGGSDYFVAMTQDIGARKLAQERVLKAEAPYHATFDQAAIGIAHTAPDGKLLKLNHRFAAMLGYSADELLGRTFMDITHPADIELSLEQVRKLKADVVAFRNSEFEKRYVRKDGSTLWAAMVVSAVRDADGRPEYFITMAQDITASKEAQERLEHQAHYDPLTDLPNRALLLDRLAQTLSQSRRKNWDAAVLFVDLDRFKNVNDTLGHDMGDLLLKEAAVRLLGAVRSGDTVARVGGDEYVVVLSELGDSSDAARVARKIIDAMAQPFLLDGHEVFVTASIGIAMFPGDGTDGETLIRNADAAMFRAKEGGRNASEFYAATMNERAMEKLLLEADLRRAVERNELLLHFQPKVNIASRKVEGFEALLRWNRAGKGLVSPAVFIPLLEDSGMIVAVGEWVIRAACAQLRDWQQAGLEAVPVAVNVSAKQFLHGDLGAVIERALKDHGVDAGLLEIEITESDAMQDPERAIRVLSLLKDWGIGIALDDFGTGYSSLGYLKRFPIDLLKLDRSFVTGLPNDPDDVSIARAVIGMAQSLGLKVIAEGVETEAQRAFLANNGCNQMQGYLFSKPVPAAQCEGFLAISRAGAPLAMAAA